MQALESLKLFLSTKYASASPSILTARDAQKLWVGLFYALWMADRAPAQQRLCADLADLPRAVRLPDAAVAVWLRAFWETMARQWTTGIDVLRMDKFLLLVRRVLAAQLAWMAGVDGGGGGGGEKKTKGDRKTGDQKRTARVLGLQILADWPFNPEAEAPVDDETEAAQGAGGGAADERPRSRKRKAPPPTVHVPVGLTLHVVDIWVDELEKLDLLPSSDGEGAEKKKEEEEKEEEAKTRENNDGSENLVCEINAFVKTLAAQTTAPAVRKRAGEALADERLPWNEEAETPTETGGGSGSGGLLALEEDDDESVNDGGSWDGFND
ncbi:nucleolar protein nop52 family [Niveomyces insectorum RCEF 264]|uniref:Nucleolar protein nop52 family n=1 Tax=Niveomyces insectorum RCEF 264 TaxID=1081102 RepID=A0A162KBC9_9HYPO|nr:nucleolar protein nop52 family [Niveomyces insectorum RCEF 264]